MSTRRPDPSHFPSYRKASTRQGPGFRDAAQRTASAQAFRRGASTYHDVRPGYPDEVSALIADAHTVADIGAGTGKLTESLPNARVVALEPSADMAGILAAHLRLPVLRATAESTALADASLDAACLAQTWHWVDVPAACAELDRVLAPGGKILLVWNTLDVNADPWILRLSRIMHSGDVHKPGFYPDYTEPWSLDRELRLTWENELTPEQLHQLMHTRSYWLRNGEDIHERMTHNLDWYLYEHMGFKPGQKLRIPYRTDAFVLVRDSD